MAVPTRPVQDGIIDPVWGQWVHDHVAGEYRGQAQGTTDAAGFLSITASSMGLTTVTGAVVTMLNETGNPTNAYNTVTICEATGPAVVIRVAQHFNPYPAPANWGYVAAGTTVIVNIYAWGTVAPGATALPAPDETRPELNPLEEGEPNE